MPEPFTSRDELIDQFRRSNADAAFKLAKQENERLKKLFASQGEDVEAAAARPSAFMTALGALGDPSQMVRGALANLIGAPGYGDLGLIEAAKKGKSEDVTTADLMRSSDVFAGGSFGDRFARASLGFLGDVATDPLSYISLVPGGASIGGKAVSSTALNLSDDVAKALGKTAATASELRNFHLGKAGDLAEEATKKFLAGSDNLTPQLWEQFLSKPGNRELADNAIGLARAKVAGDVAAPFQEAHGLVDLARKKLASQEAFLADDSVKAALKEAGHDIDPAALLAQKELAVKSKLGLAPDVDLANLFDDAAIRLSSPFRAGTTDIPVLTEQSRRVFKALDGALYNQKLKISGKVAETVAKLGNYATQNPETISGGAATAVKGMIEGARAFPKLFSLRAAAGGKIPVNLIEETRLAKGQAYYEAQAFVSGYKNFLAQNGVDDTTMQKVPDLMYAYQKQLTQGLTKAELKAAKLGGTASQFSSTREIDPQAVEANLAKVLNTIPDETHRGAMAQVFDAMRRDFNEMAAVEQKAGLSDAFVKQYLPGLMNKGDALNASDVMHAVANKGGKLLDRPDFSFAKTFYTLAEAQNAGMKPEMDLFNLWSYRRYIHNKSLAEKELAERMAFEVGMPKDLVNAAKSLVASKNEDVSKRAIEFLARSDIKVGEDDILKSIVPDTTIPVMRTASGEIMTPDDLIQLRARAKVLGPDTPEGLEAIAQAKKLGISLDNEELFSKQLNDVGEVRKLYDEYKVGLLGRGGESVITRSGGSDLSKRWKATVFKHLDPEDKQFYDGILPESFKNALEDGLDTRNLYQARIQALRSTGKTVDQAEADALSKVAKGYVGWLKMMKKGVLQWWPSYHFGNLSSIPFLEGEQVPIFEALGDALSPKSLSRWHNLTQGNKAVLQKDTGLAIPVSQLLHEARMYGFANKGLGPLDVIDLQGDVLGAQMGKTPTSKKWGMLQGYDKATGQASSYVESIGREHLFYKLRERGFDPKSAANKVNDLFTNYLGNKTTFERRLLNNTIFFYSFGKAQTINTLRNMVMRPGAVTSQLHAINGMAELLRDPNAVPLPEDVAAEAATMRSRETVSKFIGRSKAGLPQILTGVGMPMDSVTQFANVKLPKNLSIGELLSAGEDTAKRSAQLIASSTNPILKKTAEFITQRNLFFDKPLTDKTMRKVARVAPFINELLNYPPEALPGKILSAEPVLQKFLGAKDNGDGTWTANPTMLAIAGSLIPGLERGITSLNALQSPGTEAGHKAMRFLTRAKVVEVDPAKAAIFEENKRLKRYAEEQGLALSKRQLSQRRALLNLEEE